MKMNRWTYGRVNVISKFTSWLFCISQEPLIFFADYFIPSWMLGWLLLTACMWICYTHLRFLTKAIVTFKLADDLVREFLRIDRLLLMCLNKGGSSFPNETLLFNEVSVFGRFWKSFLSVSPCSDMRLILLLIYRPILELTLSLTPFLSFPRAFVGWFSLSSRWRSLMLSGLLLTVFIFRVR